jgi:hypothetical protein
MYTRFGHLSMLPRAKRPQGRKTGPSLFVGAVDLKAAEAEAAEIDDRLQREKIATQNA